MRNNHLHSDVLNSNTDARGREVHTTVDTHVEPNKSVFEGVTIYHWLVVLIASFGWLFDCMDQRIFILTREPAMRELLGPGTAPEVVKQYGTWATTSMMLGWATGGIIFGMLSDKLGRVRTMVITLCIYSGFTGLSGISQTWWDFILYRFLVGLGVGGMFGAATTLVAESVPSGIRSLALGSLQALSAMGNMLGSLISLGVTPGAANYWGTMSGWRVLFFVGILPALLIVPMIFILREPEAWRQAKQAATAGSSKKNVGSMRDMFVDPRWRRNAIVGLLLGFAGMSGLWGVGFFSPELISTALKNEPTEVIDRVRGWGTLLQDAGAFMGMVVFTYIATFLSRRLAFLGAFVLCLLATCFVFLFLNSESDAYWMLPMMGFAQLSVFAGYSIYFPELFPTRFRGTGVGFCYNTVRYLAAPIPTLLGALTLMLAEQGFSAPFRVAALIIALVVYPIGMMALIWAPETKGKPLPED